MVAWIFTAAKGRVTLLAVALMVVSSLVLDCVNPKNKIRQELGGDYVSTDSEVYRIRCDSEGLACAWCRDKCGSCVERMLARYSREHFDAHRSFIQLYDLVYPPFYALPLTLLLAYFFPVLFPGRDGFYRWLVLLPLAAMAFDYAENFTMLAAINHYEARRELLTTTLVYSNDFTFLKLTLLGVVMLILLVFGARALVRLRRAHTGWPVN
ncbi:MAG TPA: hypothetical protein VGX48_13775 [Pyrinomonadaceae bacterium]|jgi:hypothetical protein|nr:hypothetical protein [Pyrinomonadaceae bacterium]